MWGLVPLVFVEIKTIKRGPEICHHLKGRTADVSREKRRDRGIRQLLMQKLLTAALNRGPKGEERT